MTFDASSTTYDVLSRTDIHNKRVLVTGVSTGMGAEIARALTAHGAFVFGTVRDEETARASMEPALDEATASGKLSFVALDLASLASVRACATKLDESGANFDAIIANAGVMAGPKELTEDGFERQFGTNHLGHFLLINRLSNLLKPGARVVMVASAGHRRTDVDLADPNFAQRPYQELLAYAQSKTANIQFAVEFDRRHKSSGVRATAVHPGAVRTATVEAMLDALGDRRDATAAAFTWKTVAQGAATAVWAAMVAKADVVGAHYCEDCHVSQVNDDPSASNGVRSYALDTVRAQQLWTKSEEMVGQKF